MDTALEALFRAMLTHAWFTASDGDVESPTGYFGYVTNETAEVPEVLDAFADVTEFYGAPATDDIVGSFVASINSNGILAIVRYGSDSAARQSYEALQSDYLRWADS